MRFALFLTLTTLTTALFGHCQMPCGIYHDEVVFGRFDEYVETMYKAMDEVQTNPFSTAQEKMNFTRWVDLKERYSNEMTTLFTEYFLQQRLKPENPQIDSLLKNSHRILIDLMKIKQKSDKATVDTFTEDLKVFKEHLSSHEKGPTQDQLPK